MSRFIDVLAVLLLLLAVGLFALGLISLGSKDDFRSIYLLVVGGLALRASTELLRPRGSTS